MNSPMGPKQVLLRLIASMTLAEHIGDVVEDCIKALSLVGENTENVFDMEDVRRKLGRQGVVTLYETPIWDDADEWEDV